MKKPEPYQSDLCPPLINYIKNIENSEQKKVLNFSRGKTKVADEFLKYKDYANLDIYNKNILLDNDYYNRFKNINIINNINQNYNYIICHRFLHTTADYGKYIKQIFETLIQGGSLFVSARSTNCQEYTRRNKYIQNNILDNGYKYIKFFTNNEINQLLTAAGFTVIEYGAFTEISRFARKENSYNYVIAVK